MPNSSLIFTITRWCLIASLTGLTVGCGGSLRSPLATAEDSSASTEAHNLLQWAVEAQGGDAWNKVEDVTVRYQGEWGKFVPKMQPVLSDVGYRTKSREVYWPMEGRVLQAHVGPEGEKRVLRSEDTVAVGYRPHGSAGFETADAEQMSAAALVADAYSLFLFGPSFVAHRVAGLELLPDDKIDGESYSRLLALIRPGFGEAEEDQVMMWIDKETGLLFRVLFSLEGFEAARGAEVDVTFLSHRQEAGYWWPDDFRERVRSPVRAFAHAWSTEELVVGSGAEAPGTTWHLDAATESASDHSEAP